MKLIDLFEDQQHQTNGSTTNFSGRFRQSKAAFSDPKSGAFSSVKDDKRDPHMVKKYHHGPMEDDTPEAEVGEDAYVYFAQWLADQNVTNPHMPRIYDIKKIQDSTGKFIYKYQVEKLNSATELGLEELMNVFGQHFVSDTTAQQVADELDFESGVDTPDNKKILIHVMGRFCEDMVKQGSNNIKSDSLREALMLIQKFLKDHKGKMFGLDIENSGNIMFRRGPHGLQLVITDPVS
ncbi:hypothetical protein [Stenotrophomonas phage RAS14]